MAGGCGQRVIKTIYATGLPPPFLKSFAWQLCVAVRYLHDCKVLHRDIKPSNVLLSTDGTIRLADFGFARRVKTCASCSAVRTDTDESLTPYVQTRPYRAPEVLLGQPYGAAADIWSVGATIAEMATGKALLPGVSSLDQLWQILGAIPGPRPAALASAVEILSQLDPSLLGPDIAPALLRPKALPGPYLRERLRKLEPQVAELVEVCLRLDPDQRPSAAELLRLPWFDDVRPLFGSNATLLRLHDEELARARKGDAVGAQGLVGACCPAPSSVPPPPTPAAGARPIGTHLSPRPHTDAAAVVEDSDFLERASIPHTSVQGFGPTKSPTPASASATVTAASTSITSTGQALVAGGGSTPGEPSAGVLHVPNTADTPANFFPDAPGPPLGAAGEDLTGCEENATAAAPLGAPSGVLLLQGAQHAVAESRYTAPASGQLLPPVAATATLGTDRQVEVEEEEDDFVCSPASRAPPMAEKWRTTERRTSIARLGSTIALTSDDEDAEGGDDEVMGDGLSYGVFSPAQGRAARPKRRRSFPGAAAAAAARRGGPSPRAAPSHASATGKTLTVTAARPRLKALHRLASYGIVGDPRPAGMAVSRETGSLLGSVGEHGAVSSAEPAAASTAPPVRDYQVSSGLTRATFHSFVHISEGRARLPSVSAAELGAGSESHGNDDSSTDCRIKAADAGCDTFDTVRAPGPGNNSGSGDVGSQFPELLPSRTPCYRRPLLRGLGSVPYDANLPDLDIPPVASLQDKDACAEALCTTHWDHWVLGLQKKDDPVFAHPGVWDSVYAAAAVAATAAAAKRDPADKLGTASPGSVTHGSAPSTGPAAKPPAALASQPSAPPAVKLLPREQFQRPAEEAAPEPGPQTHQQAGAGAERRSMGTAATPFERVFPPSSSLPVPGLRSSWALPSQHLRDAVQPGGGTPTSANLRAMPGGGGRLRPSMTAYGSSIILASRPKDSQDWCSGDTLIPYSAAPHGELHPCASQPVGVWHCSTMPCESMQDTEEMKNFRLEVKGQEAAKYWVTSTDRPWAASSGEDSLSLSTPSWRRVAAVSAVAAGDRRVRGAMGCRLGPLLIRKLKSALSCFLSEVQRP